MNRRFSSQKYLTMNMWKKITNRNRLFLCCVVIPTTLAILYFSIFASDIYVSESRFVIRSPQRQGSGSVLGAILTGTGFSHSQDDAYAVNDFIQSRDALFLLNKDNYLVKAYSESHVDFVSKFSLFGVDQSFESLLKYYQRHIVSVDYDNTSSITTLTVRAYTAADSHKINSQLLNFSEALINRMNERASKDLVRYAEQEVAASEEKLKTASLALATYRNTHAVFDPDRQSALQLSQVSKLQESLSAARLELAQLLSVAPQNPRIPALKLQIGNLESQIADAGRAVVGGQSSLSDKAVDFERRELDRQFADKQLASAMAELETVRSEERHQQLYLERLVEPNLPDTAIEPKRLKGIFEVFVLGMLVWGVLSLLIAGVREHND